MVEPNMFNRFYGLYCNLSTPGALLHEHFSLLNCRKLAHKNQALRQAADGLCDSRRANLRYARSCAAKGAVYAAAAYKVVDFVFGTGLHEPGRVHLRDVRDVKLHLREVLRHFGDTGLLGVAAFSICAVPLGCGALLGSAAGCVFIGCYGLGRAVLGLAPAGRQALQRALNWAATCGALVGLAVALALVPTPFLAPLCGVPFLLGAARIASGLAKMAWVSCGYGAGYALGMLICSADGKRAAHYGANLWACH